jgi:hypothetical protein
VFNIAKAPVTTTCFLFCQTWLFLVWSSAEALEEEEKWRSPIDRLE